VETKQSYLFMGEKPQLVGAVLEWKGGNTLSKTELETTIRKGEVKCNVAGCPNEAVCKHHLDWDHSNDERANLAPACQIHHMLEHGNPPEMIVLKLVVRQLDGLQRQRVAMGNRTGAYEKLADLFDEECREWIGFSRQKTGDLEKQERGFDAVLEAILRRYPIWYLWGAHIKGMGPRLMARVMSEVVDIGKFDRVSSLWHYAGEHVEDGKAARKRKKDDEGNWSGGWNHRLKKASWMIGKSFVITGHCLGRELYDRYRLQYQAREDVAKRAHFLAMRRARKDWLRCLWAEWRKLDGLPVTEPSDGTWPMPEDWLNGRGETRGELETAGIVVPSP